MWFQDLLYSYNHQDYVILIERQTYRSTEQKTQKQPHVNRSYLLLFFFYKNVKASQWRKDSLFNKWHWDSGTSLSKNNEPWNKSHNLYNKINSKLINDLHVKQKFLKKKALGKIFEI